MPRQEHFVIDGEAVVLGRESIFEAVVRGPEVVATALGRAP
jgi:hypothetical protein